MKINEVLKARGLKGLKVAMSANINPPDFYQAIHGKKPFFPAWRKRISDVLQMAEKDLFPEYYQDNKMEG